MADRSILAATVSVHSIRCAMRAGCLVAALWSSTAAAAADALVDQPYAVRYGGRLVTAVFIDGQGPFDFLLDTACSRTIIYQRTRARLGLGAESDKPIEIYGIAGVLQGLPVRIEELRLAGEGIRGLTIASVRDPHSNEEEPDGILGLDVLERYAIVLERPTQRLQFFERTAGVPAPYSDWPYVALNPQKPQRFQFQFWYIRANMGDWPVTTLFDLGAGATIVNWGLAYRFGLRKGRFWQPRSTTPDAILDVLGRKSPSILLEKFPIAIGKRRWDNATAIVADAPIFELLDLADQPAAVVGPGLLMEESFAIDFEKQRLHLAPAHKGRR